MLYKIHTQEPWVYTILQRRMITVLYTKKQPINVTWLKTKSTKPPPPKKEHNMYWILWRKQQWFFLNPKTALNNQ